ncbi:DNA-binding transcriptional regulator, GntR family [Arthrobacter subterraneus]|uniref:DNA-binding transcriptional regulator, GntR family n=1 Tax=Arthrobacter subterraneus TaxID=335973 RepID=A0A1G8HSH4_9MICC|nr:GntR family transcriptional regulator [Arthrobacter subterraneus]SDI09603.1 DNA-binding transcriptional regulator, GntR family [Arthrobacter subterraneus]
MTDNGSGSASARRQLSDKASSYVRGLVMSGELRPGSLVRPETIGAALGISTTPSREALQALRVEGFLELVPRRGFIVAPLTGQDIRDLFTVQSLIGGELAARAARNAASESLAELEALHHELIAAAARNNLALLEEKNHAFHRQINRMAASRKMSWALGLVARYVPRRFYSAIEGWPQATVADHEALLEGIRHRDPEAARLAMENHIVHAGELLATHFDGRIGRSPHSAGDAGADQLAR